jgi:hypothetical protein
MLTVVRYGKRGDRIGLVADTHDGDFHFQVYDVNPNGTTHLVYTSAYSVLEPSNGRGQFSAIDHWNLWEERGTY